MTIPIILNMAQEMDHQSPSGVKTSTCLDRTSGCVKWFNNKAGYGFITVSDGTHKDSDVFVHHSAIKVVREQYRYLVQGEYVTFDLCQVDDSKHKWQAGLVKGINDGHLMCETRLESRQIRSTDGDMNPQSSSRSNEYHGRQQRSRAGGTGARDGLHDGGYRSGGRHNGGDEWMLVRTRRGSSRSHDNSAVIPVETLRSRAPRRRTEDVGK